MFVDTVRLRMVRSCCEAQLAWKCPLTPTFRGDINQ